jgi:hypothetical protein
MLSPVKRTLLIAIAIVLVAIGGAVVYVLTQLDALVERAIEQAGSEATGTPVRVGSVEIALGEGRGSIRDVKIGNPAGFTAPDAIVWRDVTVDIDTGSVRERPIVLDAVVISGPEVVFEVDDGGRVNLRVLQERLAGGGDEPEEAPASDEAPMRLRIRTFTFERGAVEVRGGGETARAELPPLTLRELGGAKGETAGELARTILRAYTEQVVKTVASRELDRRLREKIDEELGEGATDSARGLLEGVLGR